MKNKAMRCLLVLLFTVSCVCSSSDTISKDILIRNVDRTIDVSSQLVKIDAKLTIENVGKIPIRNFFLAAEKSTVGTLAHVGATDSSGKDYKVVETTVAGRDADLFWRVELREALAGGASLTVSVQEVRAQALRPHPAEISQQEHQLVVYAGSLVLYSPYRVAAQRTSLVLGTRHVETFTRTKPFTQSDTSVSYGPHEDTAPFTARELSAHYRNDSPFLKVARLERWIEVSHWGNVAIEERIELEHTGARLKGPFSRYDFQHETGSAPAGVRALRTLLPAAAAHVYYRDTNGNISTSALRTRRHAVELELRPRYPLLGGWRAHYTLGYSVPSYERVWAAPEGFVLRVRLLDHVHDDMHVEQLVTRIALPEGAADVRVSPPYAVTRLPDGRHATYLDTSGRVVVSLARRHLVEQHLADVTVRYSVPRLYLLREPLLLITALYVLFLTVIIYMRLDFSIHKEHTHS